ncbi:ABC transporter ATP-binding protein [Aquibaculum sediminis]|uniref:ABC transporter ATP-binding protein n=1 Tax=Aquibaculum sediminis TaxID=3231907 RepID=UPI003451E45A
MIQLQGVTKYYRTNEGRHYVFRDLTEDIPTDCNVGILGRNGAGKSTLLRILAKAEAPNRGMVRSNVRLSWPMGFSGGFQGSMSGADNIRFIARIYGVNWRDAVDFVQDFAELGDYMHMPIKTYSSGMRARLAVGMSFFVKFDCYLIDEIPGVGDSRFRRRFTQSFGELKKRSTMILISHSEATIRKICDVVFLLNDGTLERYDDVDEALRLYREM